MRDYFLVDLSHGIEAKRREHAYEVAAKIVIKYGAINKSYNERTIKEFWTIDDRPYTVSSFLKKTVKSGVKWTIHNKIHINDPIWNANFLHGVAESCKIKIKKRSYPSLVFYQSDAICDILRFSPFYGNLYRIGFIDRWVSAPALFLKPDKLDLSYIAGLLASSDIIRYEGCDFATCKIKVSNILSNLGIPIEKIYKRYPLISPIWGALFTPYMPVEIREKWLKLKNPYKCDIYCPILWCTYIDCDFPTKGIPYLMSRRSIYYKYKTKETKARRALEKMRVTERLTSLDNRIGIMVKEWKGKIKK